MAVISCEACGEMHHRLHKCNSVAEAELRGYQRGLDDALGAVGKNETYGGYDDEGIVIDELADVRNRVRWEIREKLESLRGKG